MEIQKTQRRWFRFRLRTLLIMITVLSVPIGWVGWELGQRRREKSAIAWVEKMGGQVYFYSGNRIFFLAGVLPDQRSWWEKKKDEWFGERVRLVWFINRDTDVGSLLPLTELKNLEHLILFDIKVSDLSPLAKLKNLQTLSLNYIKGASDFSPLAELKNLNELHLIDSQASEEQVKELRLALPNCTIDF